jgi:hypothetical protein
LCGLFQRQKDEPNACWALGASEHACSAVPAGVPSQARAGPCHSAESCRLGSCFPAGDIAADSCTFVFDGPGSIRISLGFG